MAKDFVGNNILIGDEVVFMQLGYRNLMKGVVVKLTDQTCLIQHEETNTCSKESRQSHNQVVVFTRQLDNNS